MGQHDANPAGAWGNLLSLPYGLDDWAPDSRKEEWRGECWREGKRTPVPPLLTGTLICTLQGWQCGWGCGKGAGPSWSCSKTESTMSPGKSHLPAFELHHISDEKLFNWGRSINFLKSLRIQGHKREPIQQSCPSGNGHLPVEEARTDHGVTSHPPWQQGPDSLHSAPVQSQWPWASYVSFLGLGFFTGKMGIIRGICGRGFL